MTDILTRHDLVLARPQRATDGEEQLPLEGHLQHHADLVPFNSTGQGCCHCCTCVRLAGLWVVLLQQWQDILIHCICSFKIMFQSTTLLIRFCRLLVQG